jgi:cyclophilin family peptidyl-prolyl cis-trans isomerase
MGDDFDRRWIILAGFGLVAVVIVGVILISRSGGGGSSSKTAEKTKTTAASKSASGCTKAEAPKPREESLKKPKQTVKKGEKLTAVVTTNCGSFDIALDSTRAPTIVNSFVHLAEEGFYNEDLFQRVVPGFVIQGGDPTQTGAGGPGYSVVEKPPANLEYTKGVVAMAKAGTDPPGTASGQFFVVSGADAGLPPEYALLGKVSSGIKTVETIDALGGAEEKPSQPVVMESVTIEPG